MEKMVVWYSWPKPGRLSHRLLVACLLTAALLVAAGCGPSGATSVVTGKVTLNGQPVMGTISLVGGDGKSVDGPLLDGNYTVENPPKGEVSILIKGVPGVAGTGVPVKPPKDGPVMPGGGAPVTKNVAPPAKYGHPNNGLPKLTVTGGKQTHNIELTP